MLKLLMVDDEQWVRERFSERIPWSEAGFTFMGAASSAEEAIKMMEREIPHLLLTDITMPNMSGLELAAYVRKRWPRIRIVILTAYGEFEYARQAIELGVDNYLIKLAQTPEQILEICHKVANEIEQEMDVDQLLVMRHKIEWDKEWTKKRQWTERLVSDDKDVDIQSIAGEWLVGVNQASYLMGLTLGWNLPAGSKQTSTYEELAQLQKQVGEVLEGRLNQRTIGDGCRLVILPFQQSRLFLLIGSEHPLDAFHLNQLALVILEALRAFDPMKSFIYIGSYREVGKQSIIGKHIAVGLREGIDGLAAYFYHSNSAIIDRITTPYRRIDAELSRVWVATVVKALQRENVESFKESIAVMTKLSDPPIHPADLLRLTRQMFHPEFVNLPSSVIARLTGIELLETWADYCGWWAETIHTISEWLNNRFQPPAAVRKEVQLMCRYIREHYKEDVQMTELAELVQMHPSYAGQIFKQEIGENFWDYLNRVRMEKASELLERTTMKIYEVSGAVGISDYRYFCKLFKSYTSFTPTQYKNKKE